MRQADGNRFGQRLRRARLSAGFSQSQLEDVSGIPKSRLSRYENGHVEPSIQTLERLARALNVPCASLLRDRRPILEDFFNVPYGYGVRISSSEQGRRMAHAVADLLDCLVAMDHEEVVDASLTQGEARARLCAVRSPGGRRSSSWTLRRARVHSPAT